MLKTSPARRRRLAASLGVLATAVALAVIGPALVQADSTQPITTPGTGATGTTSAGDPNNYTCTGTIGKGTPEAGVTGTQVKYSFSCNGPINGYQIETEPHLITYYDASPIVDLGTATTLPTTDGFECGGVIPGYAINCVAPTGLTGTTYAGEVITGQFTISGKLQTEPRIDPLLTVSYASATAPSTTVTSASKTSPVTVVPVVTVVTASSGPFDLGRPDDLPHDAFGHDTRLGNNPPVVVLTAKKKNGDVVTTAEPKSGPPAPKTTTKKK